MKKLVILIFPLFCLLYVSAVAAGKDWKEGVHYHAIKPEPALATGDTVEVAEFFMYTCPHCMQFEPYVDRWLQGKSQDVSFAQIPAMFGGAANLHARAFYALELMGERERLHQPFFEAIHTHRQKLKSERELKAFFAKQGVDIAKFEEAWNSFAVQTRVNRAQALMRRYGVRSVPAVVVDGRYRSGSKFRSYQEKLELVDDLVVKVRNTRAEVAQDAAQAPADNVAKKH